MVKKQTRQELLDHIKELQSENERLRSELKSESRKLTDPAPVNIHSAIDNMWDGVWEWNALTDEVFYSSGWKIMLGYQDDEIKNHLSEWDSRIHPEDREQVYKDLNDYLNGKTEVYSNIHRLLCKNGGYKWVLDRGKIIEKTPEGAPKKLLGLHTDLTGLKNLENELLASREKFRNIFLHSPIGIGLLDSEGGILEVNSKWTEIFGVESLEALKDYNLFEDPNVSEKTRTELKKGVTVSLEAAYNLDLIKRLHPVRSGKIDINVVIKPFYIKSEAAPDGYVTQIEEITEKKKAEEELLQSKNNLDLFFNTIEDFLFVLDTRGNIVQINDRVIKGLGYTREEIIGQSVLVVHPTDRREEAAKITADMLAGKERSCPVPLITKNGVLIPVETTITFGKWNGEEVLFGVSKNISEIKKSEERFANVFRHHNEIMSISSIEAGCYIDVNEAFQKKLGFTKEEVIGKNSKELSLFTNPAQREEVVASLIKNGSVREIEIEIKGKNGKVIIGLFSAQIIDVQGTKYVLTITTDITDKRIVEEKLRQKIEELDRYFTSSLDLLCIANTSGKFLRLNPEWENVLGYSLSELEGSSFMDFVHPDDVQSTLDTMSKLIAQEKVLSFENRYKCKDGSYRWIEWRSLPIGELIYAAARDITLRKNNEVKLAQYAEELKEANAAKQKFLSIISHDLRGPFQSFLGISELLAHESYKLSRDDISTLGKDLNKALKSQFHLLNDLLSWSRLAADKMKFCPIIIDANSLVEYTFKTVASSAELKHITLEKEILDNTVYFADPDLIRLVLRNLVSNSVKFTNPGGRVLIKINTENGYVKTSVLDDGVGMRAEIVQNLFRADQHYTTPGTSNEQGSGLGLILCKEIIEKHGGTIKVESIPGKGSDFIFILPLERKEIN